MLLTLSTALAFAQPKRPCGPGFHNVVASEWHLSEFSNPTAIDETDAADDLSVAVVKLDATVSAGSAAETLLNWLNRTLNSIVTSAHTVFRALDEDSILDRFDKIAGASDLLSEDRE